MDQQPSNTQIESKQFYQPVGQQSGLAEETRASQMHEPPAQYTGQSEETVLEWDALEYVHHPKGFGWIVGLVIVSALPLWLAIWLQIWTFVALLVVMAITFGVIAFRPPNKLHYKLGLHGFSVGSRSYSFKDFRAFGLISEGDFHTIVLMPAKRFSPPIHLFFSEKEGEKLVDVLGARLPMEELKMSVVEIWLKQLHF